MKKHVLVWLLCLLALSPAICQPTINCPTYGTIPFTGLDISSGGGVSATKCQRIIPIYLNSACSSCTSYTLSFSNGTPTPAFLPSTITTSAVFYANVPFGKGQTIVTLTGAMSVG